jgi:hypothetical protein
MNLSAHSFFERSQVMIEEYCNKNSDKIAAEFISAFQRAFAQAEHLQRKQEKGVIRYLILSHLYSSVWNGGYSVKVDIFDKRFYADIHEIDAYLNLDWLYGFLSGDMDCIRTELIKQRVKSPKRLELEQIRYRYVYYYHSAALKLISKIIPAVFKLPEFKSLDVDTEFEVVFGGYMDKAVTVWPEAEDENEVFSA